MKNWRIPNISFAVMNALTVGLNLYLTVQYGEWWNLAAVVFCSIAVGWFLRCAVRELRAPENSN